LKPLYNIAIDIQFTFHGSQDDLDDLVLEMENWVVERGAHRPLAQVVWQEDAEER
jgi:hypothetical protein